MSRKSRKRKKQRTDTLSGLKRIFVENYVEIDDSYATNIGKRTHYYVKGHYEYVDGEVFITVFNHRVILQTKDWSQAIAYALIGEYDTFAQLNDIIEQSVKDSFGIG